MGRITLLRCGLGVAISLATVAGARGSAQADSPTIAFVPKVVGLPYFNAMKQGLQEAGKRFGARIVYLGATTGSVSDQAEIVQSLINKHVAAVGVSANSPTALSGLAAQAKQQGIVFYSSDSQVSGPDVALRVEQAQDEDIANKVIDLLASTIGDKGDVAFVSGGATATNLNEWIRLMKMHLAAKYPKMHLVSVQYAGESINQATQLTSQLLSAYPNLKGVVGINTPTVPGAAQAVFSAGLAGKVAVTGITDPNFIRPFIMNGTVKSVVLWNPISLGYLTGWGVIQILQHHPFVQENVVPGLPSKIRYFAKTRTLLLGDPMVIDKSNVNQLNF